jgi:general secretion pathway protein F/type IV pilus assembly protein PilC
MALVLTPRELTQRSHFYQQFGQLMAAGVTAVQTLQMLERNPPAQSYREPIRAMLAQISQGATVTDAIRSLGSWTPSFDIALIQAGEHSGRLDAVCKLLSDYYEERAQMLTRMLGNMAYPVLVLHMALFIFPLISLFTPGGSLIVFFLETFGVLAVIYTAVFLGIYASQSRRGQEWRSTLEKLLRGVPILGPARQSVALARLSAALDALLSAGVNIVEAWEMAAAASGSPALQRTVASWRPKLLNEGQTPAELVKASPLFPELFGNLYTSGEVSGQLDETLKRLHKYYQDDGSRKSDALSKWVPMGFYFIVVGFVAYKIIHYYVGYFGQLDQIMK